MGFVKPYSGPEAWVYVTSGILLVLVIALLVTSFLLEKRERSVSSPEGKKKWQRMKFISFAGFFLILASTALVFFAGPNISYQNYRPAMVNYIQSFDVTVAEGITATEPLAPNSTVKFMVDSKNGLVRCHAVATNASDDVTFTCYDNSTKDFTLPLKDINNAPSNEPATKSTDKSADKATPAPTDKATATPTENTSSK
jgi:hypothetical protein